jgi:hypothetical protein
VSSESGIGSLSSELIDQTIDSSTSIVVAFVDDVLWRVDQSELPRFVCRDPSGFGWGGASIESIAGGCLDATRHADETDGVYVYRGHSSPRSRF